ncbi:RsiV family protein [Lascolabacillus massiliensis]|uniref:RsiV family protein n=1 Tax=Lascolabacillus massiliensis TaxID=1627894 RepID=UPI0006B3B732|nr:RsiV family protein [Lascolabacillus massiliensis]
MEVTIRKLIFSLLLLVIMLMVSCGNSGSSKIKAENEISFDTISINKRQHLDNDSTRPFCDISVNFVYPVKSAKTNLDTLQRFFVSNMFGPSFEDLKPLAAVEAYISNYIDNYSHDAYTYSESVSDMEELNALIPGIDVDDSEHEVDKLFYSYYESLSDSITFNQHGILSFQIKQSNSKGESASYYVSYSNHVINLNTGDQITEYDIFNAGYDKALQGLIITSLLEQNGVKTIDELEDLGFFGINEIVPNKNFLLNDKGIIYTYNKGEYSAYQLTAPQVFIPYNVIRSLLRENTIVSKLADL